MVIGDPHVEEGGQTAASGSRGGRRRSPSRMPTRDPVWRKAPWVLLRSPSLFAAFSVGTLLLVVTATAYPLFVSATGDRLVETSVQGQTVTPFGAGITYKASNVRLAEESPDGVGKLYERRRQLFTAAVASSGELAPPVEQIWGDGVAVTGVGGYVPATGPVNGAPFAGTDVLDHVQVIEGTRGSPGVWLPDYVARPLHAHPGDTVELRSGRRVMPVTVAGLYRALYAQPQTGYWRPWLTDIYPCPLCAPPPQPLLMGRDQLFRSLIQLGVPKATFALAAPLSDPATMTLDGARDLEAFAAALRLRMTAAGRDAAFRSVLTCCGRIFSHGSSGIAHVSNVQYLSAISGVVLDAEQRIAGIRGPLTVVVLAAILISLGVVAAAGFFAFVSRQRGGGRPHRSAAGGP